MDLLSINNFSFFLFILHASVLSYCTFAHLPSMRLNHSSGGRTIIFTETKDLASTLAGLLPGARALHGDIQQATREVRKISVTCALLL